jgi:uroporphyrinogen decarboxylase
MVEGGASKDFSIIKRMLMATPELMHELLEKITLSVIDYLNGQIRAGVQVVQIFDTWGGVLSPHAYQKFSLHYMHKILQGLLREHDGRRVPVIVFTKNGGLWLEKIASIGSDCVGLDWTINISEARTRIGSQVSLQGNMDPSVLYAAPEKIREEVSMILQQFGHGNGHVFNLGHGIHQHVDIDHVSAFIDAVHELSAQFH